MKFQITNSEPIQFFNTDGVLVGTILIDANGDMTLRPESGSSRDIILGDPNVAGDVQMGLVSAPINLELLGGGTITSNGNTLNIGSIANGDTVTINSTSFSGSFSGSFEGDGSQLTGVGGGVPSGTVSGSAQITELGFVTSSATASFVLNSQTSSMSVATASYVETAQTASYVLQAVSASYAPTAPGILSSSAQIATDISGAFSSDSASFSTRVTTNETNISTLTAATASYLTATPTLQQVTDQGASTSNDITISGDLTASADISLPTNASSIKFNSAELHGRIGGSYPGLTINSGVSSGDRIWLRDAQGATGPVTMSFIGLGKIDGVQSIEGQGNRPLILRGGAGPNDANDGIQMFTGDASNVYQQRFQIEADGTNVDAYFHNINGLGINDTTPTAMLDVNGNINAATDITASGDIHAIGNISASAFKGDGSNVTGVVSASYAITASHALNSSGGGTPTFIASGSTSASAAPNTGVVVEHSGSTAFSVIGDVGTLFSVDDDLTGTLFSANDISGFPVLQADATGEVYLGKSPQSLYTTAVVSSTNANESHSLCTLSTSSYDGGFFEYTAHSASNARAGNIMSTWNGSNIVYAETTTTDIGDTSGLTTEVIISGSTARLIAYSANAGYKIKTIIKAI